MSAPDQLQELVQGVERVVRAVTGPDRQRAAPLGDGELEVALDELEVGSELPDQLAELVVVRDGERQGLRRYGSPRVREGPATGAC